MERCRLCNAKLSESPVCPVCGFDNTAALPEGFSTPPAPEEKQYTGELPLPVPSTSLPPALPATLPEKRGVNPWMIIAPLLALILTAGCLLYFLLIKPVTSPQAKLSLSLLSFFDDFSTLAGDEYLCRMASEDCELTLTLEDVAALPAVGELSARFLLQRSGEESALDVALTRKGESIAGMTALFTPELFYAGGRSPGHRAGACVPKAAEQSGEGVDTRAFALRTAKALYSASEESWFSAREEGMELTLDADGVSALVRAVITELDDPEYSEQFDALLGSYAGQLREGLEGLPALLSAYPSASFTLTTYERGGGVYALRLVCDAPGLISGGIYLSREAEGDVTDYLFAFDGREYALCFDCSGDDVRLEASLDGKKLSAALLCDGAAEERFSGRVEALGASGRFTLAFPGEDYLIAGAKEEAAGAQKKTSALSACLEVLSGLGISEFAGVRG